MNKQTQLQHLYLRAGFGLGVGELKQKIGWKEDKIIQGLFEDSKSFQPLNTLDFNPADFQNFRELSEEKRQEFFQMNRQGLGELNAAWINEMADTKAQLREKMSVFWHGHFATRHNGALGAEQQINTIRTHALGKFGNLLMAIAKDPSMLRFLNNQQNRKAHPNENFAREVLELFTLGRGHYTEKDIQEAARAFTGWSTFRNGEFVFRRRQHDDGKKTFLGKTGNFGGEEILEIILEQRQTANFITEKIYAYFVNQQIKREVVDQWAKEFYESEYDIRLLMQNIFSSSHFYESQNIGARIKSPIEYLVGLMRLLNMRFESHEGPIMIQRILGQILFQPPNVAGWKEGKSWIDSSSLMSRLKIPQALIFSSGLEIQTKSSFAGNEDAIKMGRNNNFQRRLAANIDWQPILAELDGLSEGEILKQLAAYYLQITPKYLSTELLQKHIKNDSREELVKWLSMRLLCTPEFQMC